MKLTLYPMPALRAAREEAINKSFNVTAQENFHRDQAHAHKRSEAREIVAGHEPSAEFKAEADLRGITPMAMATLILSKPNNAAQRELRRQKIMKALEEAQTPEDLERLASFAGL